MGVSCFMQNQLPSRTEKWRLSVLRSSSNCIVCKDTKKLNAHHLYAVCEYPEYTNDVSNGVVVCRKCHNEFHREYGVHVSEYDFAKYYTVKRNGAVERTSEDIIHEKIARIEAAMKHLIADSWNDDIRWKIDC